MLTRSPPSTTAPGHGFYGLITRVLRDSGYSEETTQEVYLEVWRTAQAYDPPKGFRDVLADDDGASPR